MDKVNQLITKIYRLGEFTVDKAHNRLKDVLASDNLHQDPYYYPLFQKHGMDYIVQAGYFEHELPDLTLNFLCTPISHLFNLTTRKHCVLLAVGAFDPAHDGHIEMMHLAKERMGRAGYEVLGGYISPAPDDYVGGKNIEASPIHHRISKVNKLIKEDWLAVCPWYGTYNRQDINFSWVAERLKQYLVRHGDLETEICLVFGGDNWQFAKTVDQYGLACVVGRGDEGKGASRLNNTYFIEGVSTAKSRAISNVQPTKVKRVILHEDGTPSINRILRRYFEQVDTISLATRQDKFNQLNTGNNIISLDYLVHDEFVLTVSREFDLGGVRKLRHVVNQVNLPEDQSKGYCLFDDDIVTGDTVRFAQKFLQDRGYQVDFVATSIPQQEHCEILDNRDFILFGEKRGLVVKYHMGGFRVPYIYPFVDVQERCSIDDPLQFSLDIWKFNHSFWVEVPIRLIDLPISQQQFWGLIGFKTSDRLTDICSYFISKLSRVKP